jgi:hypothetical protein
LDSQLWIPLLVVAALVVIYMVRKPSASDEYIEQVDPIVRKAVSLYEQIPRYYPYDPNDDPSPERSRISQELFSLHLQLERVKTPEGSEGYRAAVMGYLQCLMNEADFYDPLEIDHAGLEELKRQTREAAREVEFALIRDRTIKSPIPARYTSDRGRM